MKSKLSQEFVHLKSIIHGKKVTLGELADGLSERSHALPILVFSLPFFLPIPMPGLSVILGKKPWYPKVWAKRELSADLLNKICEKGIWIGGWVEKITIPNQAVIVAVPKWLHKTSAAMIFVCAFLLALPLPPGTNFPPAFAMFTLALGILEGNLLLLTIGFLLALLNVFLFWELFAIAWRTTGLINA